MQDNEKSRRAWNQNAGFWDEHMADGNDFVNLLEWPAIERLLAIQPGETVLDVACGNGLTSRRLAALKARVVAFDFSEGMLAAARRRSAENQDAVEYHLLDATDETAMLTLGPGRFDAALCNMAFMDMAEIQPLMNAMAQLLRPGGRFVFSLLHPCFNGARMEHMAETRDQEGSLKGYLTTVYSIKISQYLTPSIDYGIAINGQPNQQPYFFRPLHVVLGCAFAASLVLDGLEEPAFPPEYPAGKNLLHWSGKYSEIPPVLVARVRRLGK